MLATATIPATAAPPRRRVFGVDFTPVGLEDALALAAAREPAAPFAFIVTPNAQHVVLLNRAPAEWAPIYHRDSWLCTCDSQVVRRLAALAGQELPLCAGSDLTAALFARVLQPGDRITVIGCEPEVIERLRAHVPRLGIAHHNPPMGLAANPAAMQACLDFALLHPARFTFLATGSPQSERLAAAIAARGGATGIGLCIGSSLHFITGARRRAPAWMRRAGLEWLHRLVQEPRRMWRRVFVESLPLLALAAPEIARRAWRR
ncbi:WecB/TagA/CpsF family glycosyltransferase [Falsiroseomonas sp. HC035]|uniref:WecB/TagA/CpsF family glycosyltransferase n=1 Tax=Falsiroseomonas sp. HC035 TaxID=3390999 RepID=UPI003D323749